MESKDILSSSSASPGLSDDLPQRERSVLDELARAQGGHIAFQALRRRLGLHPQALTRTLRHLETGGYIRRDELGYRLEGPGLALAPALATSGERVPVFAALVPPHLLPDQIVGQLRQRWFNGLRWYGLTESPDETVLNWTTEATGRPVRLRLAGTMIGVELEGADAQQDVVLVAPLLQALAVLYGRVGSPRRPSLTGPAQ